MKKSGRTLLISLVLLSFRPSLAEMISSTLGSNTPLLPDPPSGFAMTSSDGSVEDVDPLFGRWEGLTDQGLAIVFYVNYFGEFEPGYFLVDLTCPTLGTQSWSFGYGLIE